MSDRDYMEKWLEANFKNLDTAIAELKTDLRANTKVSEKAYNLSKQNAADIGELKQAIAPTDKKDLPHFFHDPKVLWIVSVVAAGTLLLIGKLTGVDVTGLL